jgi:hypothetical protein
MSCLVWTGQHMHVKLRDIDDCWGLIGVIVYNKRFNEIDNLDQYSAYLYVAERLLNPRHSTQDIKNGGFLLRIGSRITRCQTFTQSHHIHLISMNLRSTCSILETGNP